MKGGSYAENQNDSHKDYGGHCLCLKKMYS